VTGGRLVMTTQHDGETSYHYAFHARRPRLLPFGFAVAEYVLVEGKSKLGLPLVVYGYPGEEKLIEQRLKLAVESANLFEKMMGPLPFDVVRFAHVTPVKKEMGVSLPGLILISDGFFRDFENVDLSNGRPEGKGALSLLVVADELSHQWNFYSVPLPNELAEGVSTFTNALLVEQRHGQEAYRKMINYCANAYKASAASAQDTAIADPDIYKTLAYRGIAFCKVPVVLDMLRQELGDDLFFSGWRTAFQDFNRDEDGYKILEHAFTKVSGKDLTWFFDQWFFQSGCPEIDVEYSQTNNELQVVLRQRQKQQPYKLNGEVLIRGEGNGKVRKNVTLEGRETRFTFDPPFRVRSVIWDPGGRILAADE
jgi:aminopeptidase N